MDQQDSKQQRAKMLVKATQIAEGKLKKAHYEEWRMLLRETYAELGMDVRSKRTPAERRQQEIDKAKALLAAEGLM